MHLSYRRRGSNTEQLIENINQPFEDTTLNVPRSTFNELLAASKRLPSKNNRSEQQLFSLILYAFIAGTLNESASSRDYQNSFELCGFPVVSEDIVEKEFLDKEVLKHCDFYSLGRLYEHIYHGRKNLKGVYYTPVTFAGRMVRQALQFLSKASPRCFDPACGTGFFLLLLFEELYSQNPVPDPLQIATRIYGMDRDAGAVALTRLFLTLLIARNSDLTAEEIYSRIRDNIQCANTLLQRDSVPVDSGLFKELAPVDFFPEDGFDLIIGNPPYGLSREERIPVEEKKLLTESYSRIRSGKLNKYMLFMFRGSQLLAEEGVLSYVVPNSWLGIGSAKKLREYLLSDCQLIHLEVFPAGSLGDPSLEPVVFYSKKSGSRSFTVTNNTLDEKHPFHQFQLTNSRCLKRPDFIIPLYWDREVELLISHLEESSETLASRKDIFLPLIALQAYATGKGTPPQSAEVVKSHPFHVTGATDDSCIPYLNGKDIKRFAINWQGIFLRHGSWLADPQCRERYEQPRIAIREILGPFPGTLQATYLEEPFCYNKSVLHIISGPDGNPFLLKALLACLCSPCGSVQLILCGRKSQRALFPKLVNNDLKSFYIPEGLSENLAAVVDKLHCQPSAATESELNELTLRAYGITGHLRKAFDRIVSNLPL